MLSKNLHTSLIPDESELITNLMLAATMARIHYMRNKEPLPKANDVDAIWEYYKKYYNTQLGKAKKNESIRKYLTHAKPK